MTAEQMKTAADELTTLDLTDQEQVASWVELHYDTLQTVLYNHAALVEVTQLLHELWGGDEELKKEIAACEAIGEKLPVCIVWEKAQAVLKAVQS